MICRPAGSLVRRWRPSYRIKARPTGWLPGAVVVQRLVDRALIRAVHHAGDREARPYGQHDADDDRDQQQSESRHEILLGRTRRGAGAASAQPRDYLIIWPSVR